MRLSPARERAFVASKYHALYVIGPTSSITYQNANQLALMWEVMAVGFGHNGPPAPIEVGTTVWPQRLIVSHDRSAKVMQRVDDEQVAFPCELLGRVWCRSRAHGALLKAHYRTFKGADLRKQWIDGGVPIPRELLEFELKCLASDHGIKAICDDELMDELDDIVLKPRRREAHAEGT